MDGFFTYIHLGRSYAMSPLEEFAQLKLKFPNYIFRVYLRLGQLGINVGAERRKQI